MTILLRTRRVNIFILTDPTLISINYIQKAQKQSDSGFNDVIAQLYQETFKMQEKAKEEHIKQAKEKALEEQQKLEEIERSRQAEAERLRQEEVRNNIQSKQADIQATEPTQQVNGTVIGNDWSQVSPEQASKYMSTKTGVPVGTWLRIIYAESTNTPTATNSIGCFGYLQLHPIHGNVSSMTPQRYLDTAVSVYNSQGLSAWEVTTNGMVN